MHAACDMYGMRSAERRLCRTPFHDSNVRRSCELRVLRDNERFRARASIPAGNVRIAIHVRKLHEEAGKSARPHVDRRFVYAGAGMQTLQSHASCAGTQNECRQLYRRFRLLRVWLYRKSERSSVCRHSLLGLRKNHVRGTAGRSGKVNDTAVYRAGVNIACDR